MATIGIIDVKWTEPIVNYALTQPLSYIQVTLDSGKEIRFQCKELVYLFLQEMTKRQTQDEQVSRTARTTNGIGFNKFDAGFLTDVADRSQEYGRLTDNQSCSVSKSLKKYKRQLLEIGQPESKMREIKERTATKEAPFQPDLFPASQYMEETCRR